MVNKAVRNERRMPRAALLDGMAIAGVSIGVFSPIAAYVYGLTALEVSPGPLMLVPRVWIVITFVLHAPGRPLSRRSRRMTWFDAYVPFGLPAMFLGTGVAIHLVSRRLDRRDMDRRLASRTPQNEPRSAKHSMTETPPSSKERATMSLSHRTCLVLMAMVASPAIPATAHETAVIDCSAYLAPGPDVGPAGNESPSAPPYPAGTSSACLGAQPAQRVDAQPFESLTEAENLTDPNLQEIAPAVAAAPATDPNIAAD